MSTTPVEMRLELIHIPVTESTGRATSTSSSAAGS